MLFLQLRNQLDRFSIEEIETVEGLFYFTPAGELQLREDYHNHPESKDVIERFVEVLSPSSGAVLYRNARLGSRRLGGAPFPGEGVGGYSERDGRLADGVRLRLVSRAHALDGRRLLIRLAHSEEPLYATLRELLLSSLLVLPAILAIAGFAGYALARRALSPIEAMARRAREISPDNLQARLPNDQRDDELGSLARVFNQTLDRLERAFEQLRRFTSDASHELRTPLAMIRSVGEVGLQKDGTRADYRDTIGSMLEEVNRLTSLVDSLLTISRADAGHLHLHRAELSLMTLARESAALLEVLAEEKSLRIEIAGDGRTTVAADSLFLRQALVNVLHNAIKFSAPATSIQVRVGSAPHAATVEIEDQGPGIPAADREKVFHRFYRVDPARSRSAGGAGLGLAIAKWAVEAHGGTIRVVDKPGPGCIFQVTLPAGR